VASVQQRLGQKVTIYRNRAGLTQVQLAKKLRVAPETVNRLERGKALPSIATVEKVARALDIDLSELFRFRERAPERSEAVDRLLATVANRSVNEIEIVTELAKTLSRRSR
jgi:transcriptional regulator with XRE-family HTH domain